MMAALALAYAIAAYGYFRAVLRNCRAGDTPGDVILCAGLGLLIGPVLWLLALAYNLAEKGLEWRDG